MTKTLRGQGNLGGSEGTGGPSNAEEGCVEFSGILREGCTQLAAEEPWGDEEPRSALRGSKGISRR